jgi:hypothetical protein
MERVSMGSDRSRQKYYSDINEWNQLDWTRNIDILGYWTWSCMERFYMGSGRYW